MFFLTAAVSVCKYGFGHIAGFGGVFPPEIWAVLLSRAPFGILFVRLPSYIGDLNTYPTFENYPSVDVGTQRSTYSLHRSSFSAGYLIGS